MRWKPAAHGRGAPRPRSAGPQPAQTRIADLYRVNFLVPIVSDLPTLALRIHNRTINHKKMGGDGELMASLRESSRRGTDRPRARAVTMAQERALRGWGQPMNCKPIDYSAQNLVTAWEDGSLRVNSEYQRGFSWTLAQQQALIDSIFRSYPIPPLFLHLITSRSALDGHESRVWDIVDGQQRIRALVSFFKGEFALLRPEERKLRLPNSLRAHPAPWAGLTFSQLSDVDRDRLKGTNVSVFQIEGVGNPDEIRDLFIRLQAGTALSRQQIRDAWPGNIGPFVEGLAGKLKHQPTVKLFRLVDRRGQRSEDDRDEFEPDRQLCAQLLCAFLSHIRDALRPQGVTADDIDAMYHARTDFDKSGGDAAAFRRALGIAERCAEAARARPAQTRNGKNQRKFRKLDIAGLVLVISDLMQTPNFRFESTFDTAVAERLLSDANPPLGKTTSGAAILERYRDWQSFLREKQVGVRLDEQRFFDDQQKAEIYQRDQGICQICERQVSHSDAEYDHFPVPWASGGRTLLGNGRLVCVRCHPRGPSAGTPAGGATPSR